MLFCFEKAEATYVEYRKIDSVIPCHTVGGIVKFTEGNRKQRWFPREGKNSVIISWEESFIGNHVSSDGKWWQPYSTKQNC